MLMIRRATLRLLLLSLLAVLMAALSGCPTDDGTFPRTRPDDDDDDDSSADDDDTDPPEFEAPSVVVISTDPDVLSGDPLSGDLTVNFLVSDADSTGIDLRVEYSINGGDPELATLEDENPVVLEGLNPPVMDLPGTFVWKSADDILTLGENVVVTICPEDTEGLQGECETIQIGDLIDNTVINDLGAFCQPGHLEALSFVNGEALVPLSNGECLNYKKSSPPQPDDFSAQFYFVMVNTETAPVNFTISVVSPPDEDGDDDDSAGDDDDDDDDDDSAGDDDDSAPPPPPEAARWGGPALGSMLTSNYGAGSFERNTPRTLPDRLPAPFNTCTPDLTEADVNNDAVTFHIRTSLDVGADREAVGADLRALGENIAIYVDDETPIDIDSDCADDSNDVEESDLPAFGFNNCDLEEVVDVFDNNIYPNLTTIFGDASDVDNDCRITVLLSHRVNQLTGGSDGPGRILKSFAEPGIDLWINDLQLNPDSNEEEVIFLYAPDPVGFWNDATVPLDDYLDFDVHGRIAIAMQDLISYATHRQVGKALMDPAEPTDIDNPPAEEDWLNDSMGLIAADRTGFGAIAYRDAWIYLDRAHLLPLVSANAMADFEDRGGQFLYLRYMVELFGDAILWDIVHADTTQGIDTIAAVLESNGFEVPDALEDAEPELFDAFTLQWATAMAVSGVTNIAGGPLVTDAIVPNYAEPSFVSVTPPDLPLPGGLYGANGYQQGFDVHGPNSTFSGGTSPDGALELDKFLVLAENLDPLLYHPQTDFYGTVAERGGVVVVKISGLEQPVNYLKVETSGGQDLLGYAIRINDTNPHNPLITLEDVDGAKITTTRRLDTANDPSGFGQALDELLLEAEQERNVIGRIDELEVVTLSTSIPPPDLGDDDDAVDDDDVADDDDDDDDDDDASSGLITDTDRYSFTLAGTATLAIWADRRIDSLGGTVSLSDPFLAVVPESDVPDAFDYSQWNFGPTSAWGLCSDPLNFNYPVVMPDWLAPQANLISDPSAPEGNLEIPEGEFLYECMYDHDQDGIADVLEPIPTTLAEQVLLRQAENLAFDPDFYSVFASLPSYSDFDFSQPWFDGSFIDIDSNEFPPNDEATSIPSLNVGGQNAPEGEEAVWVGTLPPGEYVIIVGGVSGGTGGYDLSVRLIQ